MTDSGRQSGPDGRRKERRFVYGPVPSRRLGLSLGVDILPLKTCTLDCVYCQLGPTSRTTWRRRAYFRTEEILAEIRRALWENRRIDAITFSGSGEPTLNTNLGPLIRAIKRMTSVPVAVLTNGTLLHRREVRRALRAADIVVPSLDAATAAMFRKVNRPDARLEAFRLLEGLRKFRDEFDGLIWLEIMLVKGINDSPAHVRALARAVAASGPDRVHLNTVVRPPACPSSRPLPAAELEKIRRAFGGGADVAAAPSVKGAGRDSAGLREAIAAMAGRRPVTLEDISASLGRSRAEVRKSLAALLAAGTIRRARHQGKTFYKSPEFP